MLYQRFAREFVQHFGLVGIHARAFTGSENNDVQKAHIQGFILMSKYIAQATKKQPKLLYV
jgi:hypothetical protein